MKRERVRGRNAAASMTAKLVPAFPSTTRHAGPVGAVKPDVSQTDPVSPVASQSGTVPVVLNSLISR
jgi:hypothetical protein